MRKILFVLGTRPEAIKLCPILLHLRGRAPEFEVKVCATAQHRAMLDQVLQVFEVKPDHDLNLMRPSQTLSQSTSRMMAALEPVMKAEAPDMVLVQGDTTTTLCGALAAFYSKVPVGHVEAGLRTWDPWQPFPEEMNRVLTARMADLHFASTPGAARNLESEGVGRQYIHVTGNSGIDAVLHVKRGLEEGTLQGADWPQVDPSKKLIVVTAHRRESFGDGFENICDALAELARRGDVQIVYPVHRNPNVLDPVNRKLANRAACRKRRHRSASRSWCCARKQSVPRPWKPPPRAWWGRKVQRSSARRACCWTTRKSTGGVRAFTILTGMGMPAPGLATQSIHSSR